MKRALKSLFMGLASMVTAAAIAWVAIPAQVAAVLLQANTASAGLTNRTIETNIGPVRYLEGGVGETIVFVHGIYARKEHWIEVIRPLISDYHVIALDLPGFGDNPTLEDDAYLLDQQAHNLARIFDALSLDQIHIAANSMGAYIAMIMAADHPERIKSFAFIGSPLGVPSPAPSDMEIALSQGHAPLVVQSDSDFEARNHWLSPNIPYVPGPILASWRANEVAKGDHNLKVWEIVHNQSKVPTVLDLAPALASPTLILWCTPDRIFHVSGAQVLDDNLSDARVRILDNCGHLPMLDAPKRVAKHYLEFLASISPH